MNGGILQRTDRVRWRRWLLLSSASLAFTTRSEATLINLFDQELIESVPLRARQETNIEHLQLEGGIAHIGGMGFDGAPLRDGAGRPTGNYLAPNVAHDDYLVQFTAPANLNPANRFLDISVDTWSGFADVRSFGLYDLTEGQTFLKNVSYGYDGNRSWTRTEADDVFELVPLREYGVQFYCSNCFCSGRVGIDNLELLVDVVPSSFMAIPEPKTSLLALLGAVWLRLFGRWGRRSRR